MTVLHTSERERQRASEVERLRRAGSAKSLAEHLADPSWVIRRSVIAALAQLGDEAVPSLCGVLLGPRDDEGCLAAAVDALVASTGHVDSAILALCASDDKAVVCDAAQILGRRRCAEALPTLARLAEDANDNVALAAIEAVGRIGGEVAVELLIAAVRSRSFFRAFPAIDVLGRTGDPRSVGPLSELLDEAPYAIEAARALGRAGQPAAAPVLAALLVKPNDAQVRVAAAALMEVHDRHAAQLGPHRVVVDALAKLDSSVAARRLTQSLVGADPAECAAICRVLGFIGGPGSVHALVELLDAEPVVVDAAASAIASLGRDAEPLLLAALRESESGRRALLLPILARRRMAPDDVLACLSDADSNVRAIACDTLGKIGDHAAVPALFARIGDADARVSQAAVAAIQALGGNRAQQLALDAARSSDLRTRRAALRILSYFGWPSALDLFLAAASEPDDRIRDLGASGLASIDDARALSGLVAASAHPSARTRAAAVRALGQTRGEEPARRRLRAALNDADPWVRYYACQALSRLDDETSADDIGALLDDPAGHVRVAAIEALARLRGERALEALHAAALSPDPDVQRAALLGMGSVRSPSSFDFVRRAVVSRDAATRLVALSALAEFEGPEVAVVLGAATADPDESVRSAAVSLLGARPGAEATQTLVARLGDPLLRERIVGALSASPAGRIEGLATALRTATAETAPHLVSALARMRRRESEAALADAFRFENKFTRRAVAPALIALGTEGARDLVERAAASDEDMEVREVCAAILARV